MRRVFFTESLFIGYLLLLAVLYAWKLPLVLGLVLSILLEIPVAGYYIHLMQHELELIPEKPEDEHWYHMPRWHPWRVFPLGFFGNLVLAGYYGMMALGGLLTYGIVTLVSTALPLRLDQNALLIAAAIIAALPISALHYLFTPLAMARYADTEDLQEAFNLRFSWALISTGDKLIWTAAAIFMIVNVINIAVFMTQTDLVVALFEPVAEFTSMTIVSKQMARAYRQSKTELK